MNEPVKVYIGLDQRELAAYAVAKASLLEHASVPACVTALDRRQLELQNIVRRPTQVLPKGRSMLVVPNGISRRIVTAAQRGQLWDEISHAPMSTEFAITRFVTPLLAQSGWALFIDSDVLWLGDVAELIALANPFYAVMVVQHGALREEGLKMDGQVQLPYHRKNWSSVMLFNCDHPANRGLTLDLINRAPGRDLHRFCWLDDQWIGALPSEWNWLVGVQEKPLAPKLAHYTLGGPWLPNWSPRDHDELWLSAAADFGTAYRAHHAGASEIAMQSR